MGVGKKRGKRKGELKLALKVVGMGIRIPSFLMI
jgi:hypothetical protein